MKKVFLIGLLVLFVGVFFSGCKSGSDDYLTEWTFKNNSSVNVSIRIVFSSGDSIDKSWSPSEFIIIPGKSQPVKNKEYRTSIDYYYGPTDLVKLEKYVNGSWEIVFIDK